MPKIPRIFHMLDAFSWLRVKKDVPQNFRFETHPFDLCSSEMLFLGGDGVDLQKQAAVADPCTYLSLETPPFLILHGNNDHKVSLRQSERLYERLVDNGTIVNFYEIDGAEHGSYHFAQPAIQQLIVNFFNQYLKK